MCGVVTVISTKPIDRARFDASRDTLLHRGPDAVNSVFFDEDRVALGHTRLSIIDLADRANQPMKCGSLWITFNGEIYNYQELRQQLIAKGCEFHTTSDTEVLLNGYRIWGKDVCEKLAGMFAFAIWNEADHTLFAARDHFGQKPLYYADLGEGFVIASEIKAIARYSTRTLRLRQEAVVDALVQDFVAEPNTWFREVACLPAGHRMTVHRNAHGCMNPQVECYWDFTPDPNPTPISRKDALEQLGDELTQAVKAHLLADVEVGAFLSGGTDSTCIVKLAAEMIDQPMKTFSIGFGPGDELPTAKNTANSIGAIHCEAVTAEEDFKNSIDLALQLFDHPFADTSLVPTDRVSSLAADSVKVVLTGDGGDECFGGYDFGRFLGPTQSNKKISGLSPRAVKRSVRTFADRCIWHVLGAERWTLMARQRLVDSRRVSKKRRGILAPSLLAELRGYDPSEAYRRHRNSELDAFRDAQWVGIKVPLASKMLTKVDRCSMKHSLETRAPFLSPRLMEFMLGLPTEISNPRDNWYKGLLRTWLDGRISDDVLHAPKKGFSVPKNWNAVTVNGSAANREIFPNCVSASLVNPMAWKRLHTSPTVLWHFAQIERSLEKGLFTL